MRRRVALRPIGLPPDHAATLDGWPQWLDDRTLVANVNGDAPHALPVRVP